MAYTPYVDPATIHNPSAGVNDAPATWGDQINADLESLIEPAQALVYNSTVQAITDTTDTTLLFDSEVRDNDGIHSTSSNTGRLTCQTAGVYDIWCSGSWELDAAGVRVLMVYKNGSVIPGIRAFEGAPHSLVVVGQVVGHLLELAVSDYITFVVNQTSGSTLDATFRAAMILRSR